MQKVAVAVLLLFLVLSVALTQPLAFRLAHEVEDRQDALLNVWITAWDGHQLLSDPLHLFDANIFYPYPRTLAYSELLLGNALLALPVTVATGNPVLGYNLALLSSFALSAFGTYLLVLKLTRSVAAGLVAGLIFAFSSYRMTNLAQAQLLTTQWMPFALLSLLQLLRSPRPHSVVTFPLFFCLQALSSFYYGILLALTALGFWVFDFGTWVVSRARYGHRPVRAVNRLLLLAVALSGLLVLPFALPYFRVQQELGFERTLADSEPFSASLRQYLLVPPNSVLHGRWLPSDDAPRAGGYAVDALFPGLAALALALWGVMRGVGRDRWFFLVLLVASIVLSLGPRLYLAPGQPGGLHLPLPYAWLYTAVPGFKALRAPVRFDALATLALAVLAGYGVAALARPGMRAALGTAAGRTGVAPRREATWAAVLMGLVLVESWVWPAARMEPVPVGDQIPPVYRWLETQPPGPVLELPMAFTAGGPHLDYQYLSTVHWQPTPDGYSGFIPPKHGQIVFEMESFPSERSVSLLQALGVHHVLLHTDRIPPSERTELQAELARAGDLSLVRAFGADQVFRVRPRAFDREDWAVKGYLPARAAAGQPYLAYLIAINEGARSQAVRPTDVLRVKAAWEPAEGLPIAIAEADLPLVTTPDGGAAILPLSLAAPDRPGTYRLELSGQDGILGDWVTAGTVEVGEQADDAFPVPVQLAAWAVPGTARRGEPLQVKLTWRALGKIDAYYSVYVKLLDAAGNAVASWDGQPRNGAEPTLLWRPGETVEDSVALMLPPNTPTGDYTVEIGMYRAENLARALTLNQEGLPVDRVMAGSVRIEP